MPTVKAPGKIPTHIRPAAVAVGYLAAGTAYILLSDWLVAAFLRTHALTIGTWKGLAFIVLSASVLYLLLRRSAGLTEAVTDDLRESERTSRRLFLQNPEAMWVYDPESLAFLEVNEAATDRYGWSREAFLGMRVPDLEAAGAGTAEAAPRTGIPAPGPERGGIRRHRTRQGREIRVALSSHEVRYEGRPAILVAARDMTSLVETQETLRAREAELQGIAYDLTERVKEMRCLHTVLSLCNEADRPLDRVLQEVAAVLPAGLRYPDLAAARLTVRGRRHASGPFPEDGPTIRRIIPGSAASDFLEIAYRRPPSADPGRPFLPEEESLADVVSAELGRLITRVEVADSLRLRDRGLAAVPAGICITEAGGSDRPITFVNPALQRMTGYAESELVGKDCRFLQGDETDGMTKQRIREALQAGRSFSGVILNYRKNGEAFWNDLLISPIVDAGGRITHFVGIMRDVSEGRRIEQRIRLLESAVEAAASAIVITDARGRVEYANAAFEHLTGYARDEIAGATLRELKSGAHDDGFYRDLWITITAGDVWRNPILNKRKDGTTYRAAQTIAPIRDERGRIAHFVAIQEDTTALHETEERLRHGQRLQAVGQLTGGIAHDFNNILAIILGNLELLDELTTDAEVRDLIADPLAATARGAELTRRLLAFARLQPLDPRDVSVEDLIARVQILMRPALTEAVEVRTRHQPDLWQAFVDEGQLETALMNIMLNARDAMPGGGTLLIETENARLDGDYAAADHEVRSGDYVLIAVSDNGGGMTSATLAKAFDPFFTTKQADGHTGLGLSMVYGFAKQSGGHVRIYSEVDRGTTVRLYLPRSGTAGELPEKAIQPMGDGRGRSVLVVEDDEGVARWIVRALEASGFQVDVAGNAAAAMLHLEDRGDPDLVLTDVVLPGGATGVELASNLAERGCKAKILFMSGYTREAVERDGPFDPRAALLTKPFRRAELLRQVYALLD